MSDAEVDAWPRDRQHELAGKISDSICKCVGGYTHAEIWVASTIAFISVVLELAETGRQADILEQTAAAILRHAQSVRGDVVRH